MFKPVVSAALLLGAFSMGWSYDPKLAEVYAKLLAPAKGPTVEKSLGFVKPENFLKDFHGGKKCVVLDVRTPEETQFYGINLPESLAIPLDQVFLSANLKRLPTDKTIMVICKTGARAAIVASGLRAIGFTNIEAVKGGFEALVTHLGAKEANPELPENK